MTTSIRAASNQPGLRRGSSRRTRPRRCVSRRRTCRRWWAPSRRSRGGWWTGCRRTYLPILPLTATTPPWTHTDTRSSKKRSIGPSTWTKTRPTQTPTRTPSPPPRGPFPATAWRRTSRPMPTTPLYWGTSWTRSRTTSTR